MIVSDNGSNFTGDEFQQFCHRNSIKHTTSAPYHPSSNGLAERAVRTVKDGLRKIANGPLYLLTYRITPHQTTGQSPSELMFGRRLQTALDLPKPDLHSRVESQQDRMNKNHDQKSKERVFQKGNPVLVRNFGMGENGFLLKLLVQCHPKFSWRDLIDNEEDMLITFVREPHHQLLRTRRYKLFLDCKI